MQLFFLSLIKGGHSAKPNSCNCRERSDCTDLQDIQKWLPAEGNRMPWSRHVGTLCEALQLLEPHHDL